MPSIPSALEITQDIVRMDTRNPPGREVECANFLGHLLSDAGIQDGKKSNHSKLSPQTGRTGDYGAAFTFLFFFDLFSFGTQLSKVLEPLINGT